jgi:cAMP-dependent protein kinase regulator
VELLTKAITSNKNLAQIVQLDNDQIASIVAGAYKKECGPGDVIISQGDMDASSFYVVKTGEFKVSVADSNAGDDKTTTGQIVADLKPGHSFGELALLYQAPRAATVTAATKGCLFVIDRYNFKEVLRLQSQGRIEEFKKVLTSIKLFNCLLADEKESGGS